jgi:hypothetical protein
MEINLNRIKCRFALAQHILCDRNEKHPERSAKEQSSTLMDG